MDRKSGECPPWGVGPVVLKDAVQPQEPHKHALNFGHVSSNGNSYSCPCQMAGPHLVNAIRATQRNLSQLEEWQEELAEELGDKIIAMETNAKERGL